MPDSATKCDKNKEAFWSKLGYFRNVLTLHMGVRGILALIINKL